jgi:hypothetical protein
MPLHLQRICSDVSSKSSNALQQSPNTRGAFGCFGYHANMANFRSLRL